MRGLERVVVDVARMGADAPSRVEDEECNDGTYPANPSAADWPCDGVDNACDNGDRCP